MTLTFRVCCQPKYDMRTETIIGAEGLVRWQHDVQVYLREPERWFSCCCTCAARFG